MGFISLLLNKYSGIKLSTAVIFLFASKLINEGIKISLTVILFLASQSVRKEAA